MLAKQYPKDGGKPELQTTQLRSLGSCFPGFDSTAGVLLWAKTSTLMTSCAAS